jgi:hypothetical protein
MEDLYLFRSAVLRCSAGARSGLSIASPFYGMPYGMPIVITITVARGMARRRTAEQPDRHPAWYPVDMGLSPREGFACYPIAWQKTVAFQRRIVFPIQVCLFRMPI